MVGSMTAARRLPQTRSSVAQILRRAGRSSLVYVRGRTRLRGGGADPRARSRSRLAA